MKRTLSILLTLVMLLSLCLTACEGPADDPNDTPIPHPDDHAPLMLKVDAAEPTCDKAGNTEHYKCVTCQRLYTTEDASAEIVDVNSVVIAAHHTFDSDGNCSFCSEVIPEKIQLLDAIKQISYTSFEISLSMTSEGDTATGYVAITATSPEDITVDFILNMIETYEEETEESTGGIFIRGNEVFSIVIEESDYGDSFVSDFRADVATLKAEGAEIEYLGTLDELLAQTGGDIGTVMPDITLPDGSSFNTELIENVITQLSSNATLRIFSAYEKTETGYAMTFDIYKFIDRLFDGLIKLGEIIDKDNQEHITSAAEPLYNGMKISEILKTDAAKSILAPYFKGITATQIKEVIEQINTELPAEQQIKVYDIDRYFPDDNGYDYFATTLSALLPNMTLREIIQSMSESDGATGSFDVPLNTISFKGIITQAKDELLTELQPILKKFTCSLLFDSAIKPIGGAIDFAISTPEYDYDYETGEQIQIGTNDMSLKAEMKYLAEVPAFTDIKGFKYTITETEVIDYTVQGYENFFVFYDSETDDEIEFPGFGEDDFTVSGYDAEYDYISLDVFDDTFISISDISTDEPWIYDSAYYISIMDGMYYAESLGAGSEPECNITTEITADGTVYYDITVIVSEHTEHTFGDEIPLQLVFTCQFTVSSYELIIE